MKIHFLLLSLVNGSLKNKIKSNWFTECLQTSSKKERCIEFDFMASMTFIKKEEKTGAYSPFCSDINILAQCVNGDFGPEYRLKGNKNFNYVMKQMRKINPTKFKALNSFYKKVEILRNNIVANDYLHKVFLIIDAEKILNEHVDRVTEHFAGSFTSPFDLSSFKFFDSIYGSMVQFKDDWARKFDIEESYVGEYFLNETSMQSRNFMYKHDNYFYKMINDEVTYEIIAIPYSAGKGEPYPRFMVTLVPVQHETDLSRVWDSFYTACNGDIQNFIKKQLYLRLVKLHIPKLNELKSVFDLKVLLDTVYKNNTVNSSSKITTCLNIDETGSKEVVVPFSLFDIVDFDFGSITVKANRPHLSFIFDMGIQRILFVVKDTGY